MSFVKRYNYQNDKNYKKKCMNGIEWSLDDCFLCVKKIYNIVYNKSISFTVKVIKVESHS